MRKPAFQDWTSVNRHRANCVVKALKVSLPEQWAGRIGALEQAVEQDGRVPFWRRSAEWVERLEAFQQQHGEAKLWAMGDADLCAMADDVASKLSSWMAGDALWPTLEAVDSCGWLTLTMPEKLDVLAICCDSLGVDMPKGLMAEGVIARGQSAQWWRRALRKKAARVVEHGAIKLGVVNRTEGAYASDNAVKARAQQLARNAAALARAKYRNEAGQVYSLAELSALSVANPDNRRGELMARIRGAEWYADTNGHPGLFLTLTCPSRFHAVLSTSKKGGGVRVNPKYDENQTPREAQLWLRVMWSRVRADLARQGVTVYGIRVAEPHHDGCPHWHALLWFGSDAELQAGRDAVLKHWLSDAGDEPGAKKNRVNIKAMKPGGAAGYVAKYVAKNVGGSVNVDGMAGGHTDGGVTVQTGGVKGVERVDAWAGTWGVRQFQTIGLPPVGVWRKLRGVDRGQVEQARVKGDAVAWRAWGAVQKVGDMAADFGRFIVAMGGVCLKRSAWPLQVAYRVEPSVNQYGEALDRKTAVGVEVVQSGRWLVSKKVAWRAVAAEEAVPDANRADKARPWTRFNNCTARLGGTLRAALIGLDKWRPAGPGDVAGGYFPLRAGAGGACVG